MFNQRREQYLKFVNQGSISLLFSGLAPQRSQDDNYPFAVNRNFYYLTGIDQENVVCLMIKGETKTQSFIFMDPIDPLKVLWDGAGFSFEEAAKVSGVEVSAVKDIKTLDSFITQLLSTSRRAVFGDIHTAYLDLDRLTPNLPDSKAQTYAKFLTSLFPFIDIKPNQNILARLRTVKNDVEVEAIKKAINITKDGINRLMSTLKPGETEYGMEAEFNYVLNKNRATPAFGTIAATGANATTLHYRDNDATIKDGELMLYDLGACRDLYSADISRTLPVNGKFTDRQKAIYEVVLSCNKKTIEWLKPGITMAEFNQYGKDILIEGAKKLGLIEKDEEILKYYYHSLGHYLGLDIHDVGRYSEPIPVGAIITVEPGLYIAEEGIGIRIEDDVLVTEDGCINLSKDIIKEVKDIEAFMAK
ncbi:aminopeptidase P family protein [Mycoplasmatota bacterium]|nr:aminopeptidase P family protein [Mycoplasmatota bacterium]